MTKKYTFKQIAPEYQESYFEPYTEDENLIFINNRNIEIGDAPDLWLEMIHGTYAIAEEVEEMGNCTPEQLRIILLEEYPYQEKQLKNLTEVELLELLNVLKMWGLSDDTEEYENIKMYNALTGGNWNAAMLRGYCQSDWIMLYYNQEFYSDEDIKYVEDVLFNMGTEWECDGTWIYVPHFENPKEYIANDMHVDVTDIELWEFDGWKKTPKYKAVL